MTGEIVIKADRRRWTQIFGALIPEEDLNSVIQCQSKTEARACERSGRNFRQKSGFFYILNRQGDKVFVTDEYNAAFPSAPSTEVIVRPDKLHFYFRENVYS